MAQLMAPLPPHSEVQPVTDVLHGIPVTDRYRWLEDGDSPRTRVWIEEQSRYARAYLDSVSGRDHIRQRIRDFLTVDTFDSLQRMGNRYLVEPSAGPPCFRALMTVGTSLMDAACDYHAHARRSRPCTGAPYEGEVSAHLRLNSANLLTRVALGTPKVPLVAREKFFRLRD